MSQINHDQNTAHAPRDWVLVVDDDEPIRNVLSKFLEDTGLEIVGAENANVALEILAAKASEPLVAFVDVLMPGMDGLTLARKLKAQLKHSTLVIISGHMNNLSWWPMDLSEVTFLAKPFRLAEVTEIVNMARSGFDAKG
jgi:two-component system, cell cycle sensor histidine kinase and response regulator CckA